MARSALHRRQPSMMLAWFSSSETMRSPSCISVDTTPTFAVYPDWKTRAASVDLNRARRVSSSRCRDIVPAMVRTAPGPAPNSSIARQAAATTFGCVVRPR